MARSSTSFLQLAFVFAAACAACGSSEEGSSAPAPAPAATTQPGPSPSQPGNPATTNTTPTAQPAPTAAPSDYAAEKAWAEAHGVTIEAGKVTVVAKRKGADKRSDVYEDMFVVFKADGTTARFIGTTKPAQMPNPDSQTVPDVDHDGRKDLGIVRPGLYIAHGSLTYGLPGYERTAFKVKTDDGDEYLPAWRDLSGDGNFSTDEKNLAVQRDYKISGIYIHYGFADNGTKLGPDEYIGPWSVGCQNIKYAELDSFVAAVGGPDATFRYAIVQAN